MLQKWNFSSNSHDQTTHDTNMQFAALKAAKNLLSCTLNRVIPACVLQKLQ